jgi:hypothetical protein
MASVSKKISSDEYELIADTQGLLIPQSLRYCRVQAVNGQTVVPGVNKILLFNRNTLQGEDFLNPAGDHFVAPVTGIYAFKFYEVATLEAGDNSCKRAFVGKADRAGTTVEDLSYITTDYAGTRNYFPSLGVTVYLEKGESVHVTLSLASTTKTFTVDISFSTMLGYALFTLLEQKSPYLVANKGALVSGGAFEFDLDGHCFPEIYSTDEVRCGRWIDGKPIYKKTIDCGYLPDTAKKTINVNIPDLQLIIKMEGFY